MCCFCCGSDVASFEHVEVGRYPGSLFLSGRVLGGKAEGTLRGGGLATALRSVKARGACGVPFDMYPRRPFGGGDESESYI